MKRGFYIETAWSNIRKNYRFFIPQILTGTGLLSCLYIVYTLTVDERIAGIPGGDYIPPFMSIGTVIISLLSVVLVLYTNSFLMRQRKREYGLYNVLGMEKRHIGKILFYETAVSGGCSVLLGSGFGLLSARINKMDLAFSEEKRSMSDWYTIWVHQIKTPIAVLKLKVPESEKEIRSELFRIEEYADMALSYIRLGSEQNDLVIKEYSLDELIRETLRKYAAAFITGKIRLNYLPTEKRVITDKKWLLCILEQYISNAVKYTHGGTVTVEVCGNTLSVSDTGIGISREDLPRIFEKCYTGNNGRADAKSSGLGLYLSRKAAALIGVTLSAKSTPGCGSRFSITFPHNEKGPAVLLRG